MKRLMSLALAVPFVITGCVDDAGEPGDEPTEDVVLASTNLATFHLGNGNIVEFEQLADGDLAVGETTNGKTARASLVVDPTGQLDPLERYLVVAPPGTPVPAALAALDAGRQLIADRAIVPALAAPIEAATPSVFSAWDVDVYGACSNADQFYNDVCMVVDTDYNEFWFCDWVHGSTSGNGVWYTLIRNTMNPRWGSSHKKERSTTWTLSCSTPVRVRHQAELDDVWATVLDKTQSDHVISSWTNQGSNRHRQVRHERTDDQSGLRALTFFR